MAAYTVSYQAPQYGSAMGQIGSKISGAMDSAAQKRKEIDDEIAALEEKKQQRGGQLNDEDSARLQDLQTFKASNSPGSLAVSQMISDFGGDRLRRTMGFFQKNPADENDPGLDKKKRFDALINKTMKPQTTRQLEIEGDTLDDNTKLALSKLTQFISDSVNGITEKVRGLKDSDAKSTKIQIQTNNNVQEVVRHFAKNNEVQKESNAIQQDLFEQTVQAADDRESDEIEARGEAGGPATGTQSYSWGRDNKGGGGILKGIFNLGKNLLGFGGKKAKVNPTQYSGQIGPQPMNSAGPWSAAGPGEFGNAAGFVPRMPARVNMSQGGVVANNTYNDRSRMFKAASGAVLSGPSSLPDMRKMSAGGGMVDSPTLIPNNSAVIPKDKMTEAVKGNPENQKKAGPFAKLLQLPTLLAGSIMTSITGSIFSKGGMSKLFRPVLRKFIAPAAMAFGIPSAVAMSALGGSPAQAAPGGGGGMKTMKDPLSSLKGIMSKFQGAMGMNQTAGMAGALSPGGNVTNAAPVSGYSVNSGFGQRIHPITGAVSQHDGIDYNIPQGKLISLKKGGEVTEVLAPNTGRQVSGIVRITHPDGTESRYVHLSKVMVRKGQQVSTGQAIGAVGGEPGLPGGGGSTGPHLHFEYYPSTSSGPADGSAVAGQYFMVGGQLNASPPQSAAPQAQRPRAAANLPSSSHQGPVLLPIQSPIRSPQPSILEQNSYSSSYLSIYNFESPYTPFLP